MKTYSDAIQKAYKNWMTKIEQEPDNEWEVGYKNKLQASKRAGDKFEKLCKAEQLNYINVSMDLTNFKIVGR